MKTTPVLASIVVLFLATPSHSGGIKKWTDEDGTITYGDVPPPGTVNIETIKKFVRVPASAASGYYSPQNQLTRMRALKRQKDLQRRQRENMARQDELSRQQARMRHQNAGKDKLINMARCSQYQARIKEYEHKTIQAYSNKSDRLNDESRLALLRTQEAEHCN